MVDISSCCYNAPMVAPPLLLLLSVLLAGCLAAWVSPGTGRPCLSTELPVDTLSRMVETVNHWTFTTLWPLPRLALAGPARPTNRPI